MTLPYPLPRETRSTGPQAFDGVSVTFGPFAFRIFDTADVIVQVKHSGDAEWSDTEAVTVSKEDPDEAYDYCTVTFDAVHPATSQYQVLARRLHERSMALSRGNGLSLPELEKETTKQGTILQEMRRDSDAARADRLRALRVPDGETLDVLPDAASRANRLALFDANGHPTIGPTAQDIAAAQENAAIATAAAATFGRETIAAMTAISDSALTQGRPVVVTDLARGGQFIGLPGSPAANGLVANDGTVFASDGGGATYLRLVNEKSLLLRWFDVVGTDDDMRAFNRALAAIEPGQEIALDIAHQFDNGGDTGPISVDTDNITIRGVGMVPLTFLNYRAPGIEIRGRVGVAVNGLRLTNTATPVDMGQDPGIDQLPARNWSAGVYVIKSHDTTLSNLIIDNFACGIDYANDRDTTDRYRNNRASGITIRRADQGVLFGQLEDPVFEDIIVYDTTRVQRNGAGVPVEPHGIYGTYTTLYGDPNTVLTNLAPTLRNCRNIRNPYDGAFKLKYCPGAIGHTLYARSVPIVLQVEDSPYCQLNSVTGMDLYDAGANTQQACHFIFSPKFNLTNAVMQVRDGETVPYGYRASGSPNGSFNNVELWRKHQRDLGNAACFIGPATDAEANVIGSDNVEINDLEANTEGAAGAGLPKELVRVTDSDNVVINKPGGSGTNIVAITSGTSSNCRVLVDAHQMKDGLDPVFFFRDLATPANSGATIISAKEGVIDDFTVEAATPGNLTVTHTSRSARWVQTGFWVDEILKCTFDTGSDATGTSGAVRIKNCLPANPSERQSVTFGRLAHITTPNLTFDLIAEAVAGTRDILLLANRSGTTTTSLSLESSIGTDKTGVTIELSLRYRADEFA